MASDLHIDIRHTIPRSELQARATRAGGAGGQHVNTSSTRVEVIWNLESSRALDDQERSRARERLASRLDGDGNLRVVASDTRSQTQNRLLAEKRLAELVRRALQVPKVRRKTRPSRASKEQRLEEKKQVSRKKQERRAKEWD